MTTCFDNITPITIKNMRGGNGDVTMRRFISSEKGIKNYALLTLPPNTSIGYHTHVDDAELIYCVSGKGIVIENDTNREFTAGDINYTPKGCSHSIKNDSDCDLNLLITVYDFI